MFRSVFHSRSACSAAKFFSFWLCAWGLFAAAFPVVLWSTFSFGRDIYVNNHIGNDRYTGENERIMTTPTGPVRTLRRALELAQNGDRIVLQPTGIPFKESMTLTRHNHSGSTKFPFVIEGSGAVLDGTADLDPGVWEHVEGDLFRFLPPVKTSDFSYFRIFDRQKPLTYVEPEPGAKTVPELEADQWTLVRGRVYFMAAEGKTPRSSRDYDFVYTDEFCGITLLHVENVRIHDLTVQGFQIDGIAAFNSARGVVLDNVVCNNNGRSGLNIGGASDLAAGYCTFRGNLGEQIVSQAHSRAVFHGCLFEPELGMELLAGRIRFEDAADGEAGAREYVHVAKEEQVLLPMPEKKKFVMPPRTIDQGIEVVRTPRRQPQRPPQRGSQRMPQRIPQSLTDLGDPSSRMPGFPPGAEGATPFPFPLPGMLPGRAAMPGDLDADDPFADEAPGPDGDTSTDSADGNVLPSDLDADDPFAE